MNNKFQTKIFFSIFFIIVTFFSYSQSSKFKVVLDAGHGGKDFGACYHGQAEKNICLAVVLKVGKILEKNPNIDVVYTRKSDVFIELNERADIANRKDASIFISIHCNANKSIAANGFETYIMGVAKNKANLEVAKFENEVVTLEKDYKQTYEGYNPNSPESAIGMIMLQEEYLENSIALAESIQNNFLENKSRKNRGIKTAGFLVLKKVAMPRILVEMGFISNVREGQFLSADEGQDEISKDIAAAIVSYKKEYFGAESDEPKIEKSKNRFEPVVIEKPIVIDTTSKVIITKPNLPHSIEKGLVYKIQLSASSKKIPLKPANFKGLNDVTTIYVDNLYKYFYGSTTEFEQAKKNLVTAKAKGYKSAYLVGYLDGEKVNIVE